jgi:hypothetical protein
MLGLALVIHWRPRTLLWVGSIMIVTHNLLDGIGPGTVRSPSADCGASCTPAAVSISRQNCVSSPCIR